MTPAELAAAIEACLRARADPACAAGMRAYMRGQFVFLGIPAPARRAAAGTLVSSVLPDDGAVLATAVLLWGLPEREFRYAAIDLLARQRQRLDLSDLPALQALMLREPWWDTVDALSAVIGGIVHTAAREHGGRAHAPMDDWVAHPDFWVRRAAMLHQLGWRLETDQDRLAAYALLLGSEGEFFIQKAIGWALRDYARWNPAFVRGFVDANRTRLSSLSLREACKRLPAVDGGSAVDA